MSVLTTILNKSRTHQNHYEASLENFIIDTDTATIGDMLYNFELGMIAELEAVCEDPYDFTGEPQLVGYVSYPEYINGKFLTTKTDHWYPGDCVVLEAA